MTVQRMDTDLPRPGWPQGVSLGPVGGSLKAMDFGSGIKRKTVGARAAQGGRTSSSPAVDTALLGPWEWNLDSGRMMAPGTPYFLPQPSFRTSAWKAPGTGDFAALTRPAIFLWHFL